MTHFLQPVAVVIRSRHQGFSLIVRQIFPPQGEEQGLVLDLSQKLLHAGIQSLGVLALGIGCEPQTRVSAQFMSHQSGCFHFLDRFHKIFEIDLGR